MTTTTTADICKAWYNVSNYNWIQGTSSHWVLKLVVVLNAVSLHWNCAKNI